jgi:membrane-bound metal-dependent hydrolase YbcI (DUF457 family)
VIAGHFGFAAIVKSRERQTPLWALMLACQWLDVVFVPLFLAGIERIVPVPGTSGTGYGEAIIYADYTHSLLGAIALSLLFGLVAALLWGRRTGVVLGSVVFSHWLLDLIVHRADMPMLPGGAGNLPRMGLGLWRVPPASIAVELTLVVAGAYLYSRAAIDAAAAYGGGSTRLAYVASGLLLFAGLLTLALNVLGV